MLAPRLDTKTQPKNHTPPRVPTKRLPNLLFKFNRDNELIDCIHASSEVAEGMTPTTPEENLWLTTIYFAIEYTIKGDRDERRWLFYDNEVRVGSLPWICEHLGMDLWRIRKLAMRAIKEKPMRVAIGKVLLMNR